MRKRLIRHRLLPCSSRLLKFYYTTFSVVIVLKIRFYLFFMFIRHTTVCLTAQKGGLKVSALRLKADETASFPAFSAGAVSEQLYSTQKKLSTQKYWSNILEYSNFFHIITKQTYNVWTFSIYYYIICL